VANGHSLFLSRLRNCPFGVPLEVASRGASRSAHLAAEVQKGRGKKKPLSVAQGKALRDQHAPRVRPLQALAAEARQLERGIADLVNAGYGLTPEEVALMWRTAPPRMPGEPPVG
jgi:hypothetical protein